MDIRKLTKTHATADARSLSIPVGDGETVDLTYHAASVTPALLNQLAAIEQKSKKKNLTTKDEVQTASVMVAFLVSVLVDWNLTENGKPVPIEQKTLEQLGIATIAWFWEHIKDDLVENSAGN